MLKYALVVGLAAGLAAPALAQRPGGFGGFGGPGFLLRNESVQKELKLTGEQKDKLKTALEKVREDHKDDLAKAQDLSQEERQKLFRTIGEETNKAVAGILDANQVKRLHQIERQQQGARAFANPEVQKELKLTDEQKDKIKEINEESGKKMRELFQPGGDREEAVKKMAELRKETIEKATGVLTAEQKKAWKEMTGEPFEIKFDRQPGGRPRGGARNQKDKDK
jgi:Spy/CpxP family protein refolding chaperone